MKAVPTTPIKSPPAKCTEATSTATKKKPRILNLSMVATSPPVPRKRLLRQADHPDPVDLRRQIEAQDREIRKLTTAESALKWQAEREVLQ